MQPTSSRAHVLPDTSDGHSSLWIKIALSQLKLVVIITELPELELSQKKSIIGGSRTEDMYSRIKS